jgi:hypothetical protein
MAANRTYQELCKSIGASSLGIRSGTYTNSVVLESSTKSFHDCTLVLLLYYAWSSCEDAVGSLPLASIAGHA